MSELVLEREGVQYVVNSVPFELRLRQVTRIHR